MTVNYGKGNRMGSSFVDVAVIGSGGQMMH